MLALLLIVIVRFNAQANPTPSRTTHNTPIEVLWTVVPVLILVVIAILSFRLLFAEHDMPQARPDREGDRLSVVLELRLSRQRKFEFNSLMRPGEGPKPGQPRLLAVDNALVVPVNKVVHVLVTGADVIHSFAVPAFGIKIDAVPGPLNETWFKADQRRHLSTASARELCGKDHAFMPIEVRVVSAGRFRRLGRPGEAEIRRPTTSAPRTRCRGRCAAARRRGGNRD